MRKSAVQLVGFFPFGCDTGLKNLSIEFADRLNMIATKCVLLKNTARP